MKNKQIEKQEQLDAANDYLNHQSSANDLLNNEFYMAGGANGFILGKKAGKREGFWKGVATIFIGSLCLGAIDKVLRKKYTGESK